MTADNSHSTWRPRSGPWTPLLSGKDADDALEILDRVEAYLVSPDPLAPPSSAGDPGTQLIVTEAVQAVSDCIGSALYYAYRQRVRPDPANGTTSMAYLRKAFNIVARETLPHQFMNGFTGVGWLAEHLHSRIAEEEEIDLSEIDEYLLDLTSTSPWTDTHDLIGGLAGFGAYALERMPRDSAVRILENVIQRLDETAERNADGATWYTSPSILPHDFQKLYPEGYHDLGVAHGVPGPIVVLSGAVATSVALEISRSLLDAAMKWLLAQRMISESEPNFCDKIAPGREPRPGRLAWCYGDPGVGMAILTAGCNVARPDWIEAGAAVGLSATRRSRESSGIVDGFLCHGSTGVAHLFNRFWQATGEPRFAEAARYWFRDTYIRMQGYDGLQGLKNHQFDHCISGCGVLSGVSGVGLALLAMLGDEAPDWDWYLLVGAPPRIPR